MTVILLALVVSIITFVLRHDLTDRVQSTIKPIAASRATADRTWLIEYGVADNHLAYVVVSSSRGKEVKSPLTNIGDTGKSQTVLLTQKDGTTISLPDGCQLREIRDGVWLPTHGSISLQSFMRYISEVHDQYSIDALLRSDGQQ
jgi:hypothetical protein